MYHPRPVDRKIHSEAYWTSPPGVAQERQPAGTRVHRAPQSACSNLYQYICTQRGTTHDPTGTVRDDTDGEIKALRIYEEIIRSHPDWDQESIDNALAEKIFTPVRRKQLQSTYEWTQAAVIRFLSRQSEDVFTQAERQTLKKRIMSVPLVLPPPAKLYADEPDLFTKTDVYFERTFEGKMQMRVGGAYVLAAQSWFNRVFTFAHELGHSIDPCETRSDQLAFPAMDRLSACFMSSGLVPMHEGRRECGSRDQLSETFADWIAGHVIAEALARYATEFPPDALRGALTNSLRDLCETEQPDDGLFQDPASPYTGEHPKAAVRIQNIVGNNPKIRAILACEEEAGPQAQYCSW